MSKSWILANQKQANWLDSSSRININEPNWQITNQVMSLEHCMHIPSAKLRTGLHSHSDNTQSSSGTTDNCPGIAVSCLCTYVWCVDFTRQIWSGMSGFHVTGEERTLNFPEGGRKSKKQPTIPRPSVNFSKKLAFSHLLQPCTFIQEPPCWPRRTVLRE